MKNYSIYNNISALPYQMNLFPIHIFYIPDVEIQLYDPKICKGLENEYKTLNKKNNISDFSKKIMNNNENLFKEIETRYTGKKI